MDRIVEYKRAPIRERKVLWKSVKRHKVLYIMIIPVVLYTLVFNYLPMTGLVMAFEDYNLWKGPFGSPFIGLKNFRDMFSISMFREATLRTLWYGVIGLVVGFPAPIILALMFNEIRQRAFKRISQTLSYLPYFLSWAAVTGIIYTLLATDGLLNDLLALIFGSGYERTNLLMNINAFLPIYLLSGLWKGVGWGTVVYLSAITGIDSQIYEAAVIDGCSKFKQIIYITLPGIMPTIMIILIFSVGGIIQANFEQIYGLQNVYTQKSTEVISTVVYRSGIMQGQYSISTAFGLAQGLVSFILVFTANKITTKLSDVGIF